MAVPARRIAQAPPARRRSPRLHPAPAPRIVRPVRRVPPRQPSRPAARPAPGRGTRRLPFLLVSLVAITLMVVGLVSAQTMVAQGSFRVQALSRQADRLESGLDRLRLKGASLSSLDRIQRAARRAGLVYAGPFHPLTVPRSQADDDTPGLAPGVAGAADVKAAMGAPG